MRFISLARGQAGPLFRDTQIRVFFAILLISITVVTASLLERGDVSPTDAIRMAAFNVTSIITTTGYATDDYAAWTATAGAAFFVFMWIGGCTGSTTGGLKIFRFEMLALTLRVQLTRLFSPNRVLPITYNGRPIDTDVMLSAMSYLFISFTLFMVIGTALGSTGLDFVTAFSASASALMNIGPGLGDTIGPAGNYSTLPDMAKWLLCVAMLLGRLEILTVLVLLNPGFWQR